jgi:hypothetical protein
MNDLCSVSADLRRYEDEQAALPDADEPSEYQVHCTLDSMVDDVISDVTHPLVGEGIANCSEAWEALAKFEPVENVSDLTVSQAMDLARTANRFIHELRKSLQSDLYEKALQKARRERSFNEWAEGL